MDVVNQLVAQGQFTIIKQPLGFIKVLQWRVQGVPLLWMGAAIPGNSPAPQPEDTPNATQMGTFVPKQR